MKIKIGGLYKLFNPRQKDAREVGIRPINGPGVFIRINVGTLFLVIEKINTDNMDYTNYPMFLCLVGDKLYQIPQEYIGELNV